VDRLFTKARRLLLLRIKSRKSWQRRRRRRRRRRRHCDLGCLVDALSGDLVLPEARWMSRGNILFTFRKFFFSGNYEVSSGERGFTPAI
jgi:hypothetical protein